MVLWDRPWSAGCRIRDTALTVLGNTNRTGIEAALAHGAIEAASARELAEASDIVMLCMGTSDHVESRMRGADGVIAGLGAGKVVIDFGTSLPGSTVALGAEVEAASGATMLDAPLGRTPAHAVDGLLNIMAAGDKATYDQVLPVLKDLGENVFHLGKLRVGPHGQADQQLLRHDAGPRHVRSLRHGRPGRHPTPDAV